MADKAHVLTDEKLEEMEKRLSAIYSRAEKEIGERWKEYLVESQTEIDELQKAYELAKKGGDAKEIRKAGKNLASAKRERTLMDKRFKAFTKTTAAQLANVNKTALAYVNGQLPEVYSINYNALSPSVQQMELSKKEKAARAEYYRKWRAKNPEKVKAAFKKYWLKKAEEMKAEERKEE